MALLQILLAAALLGIFLPLRATAAEAGHALSFDGMNDFVSLANAGQMIGPDWGHTKTISLWVKPLGPSVVCAYSSPAKCDLIFGDKPEWWGIVRGSIDGQDRIWLWNFDGNYDMVGISYTAGEWVHITLVHSSGVLHAYRNGVEVDSVLSGPTRQPPPPALPVLHLGGMIFSSSRVYTYEGLIDEVQVWKIARSTAEIRQGMYSILVGDESGLSAYYRMSDGAGLTLTDDSINNWNGVLHDGGDSVLPDGAPPQWVLSDAFPSDNDYPAAADDAATTAEDAAVTLPVLANDSDPDGDALTVTAAGPAAHGAVTTDGITVTYTPNANFFGADSFPYRISDGKGGTATGQVNIIVTPVDGDPPVAVDDATITAEDAAVIVPVLANDSDPDGDALTVTAAGPAAHGTVTTNTGPGGAGITYTPNLNFFGADGFAYTISDGKGESATARVSITVTPVNDLPIAVDDAATTAEDAAVIVPVLANDSDPDGDALTVTAAGPAAHGIVTTDPGPGGAGVTYTPDTDFYGADSFSYTISDGNGGTATAQVNIIVTPVDDPPVAVDDAATTAEDATIIVTVLANDSDPDGDPLTVTAAGPAVHGTVTTSPGPGWAGITYTPDTDFYGTDSLAYTISDGKGGTATAQVNIIVTPVNDTPVAVDDAATTAEDATIIVTVLANDSDPDGDPLTVIAAGPAAHGTVTTSPDPGGAGITYTPNLNFFGADSFAYTISDGKGGTATAQVSITVTPVNDLPIAVDDAATTAEDAAVIVPVLANDSDPDGDPLTLIAAGPAVQGMVTTDPDPGGARITYTPNANFYGADSFAYTISDGKGGTATGLVNITITKGISVLYLPFISKR